MPRPKKGDELIWEDRILRLIDDPVPPTTNIPYPLGCRAEFVRYTGQPPMNPWKPGQVVSAVFSDITVEESGWRYAEDDFTRWVKEVRQESGLQSS